MENVIISLDTNEIAKHAIWIYNKALKKNEIAIVDMSLWKGAMGVMLIYSNKILNMDTK